MTNPDNVVGLPEPELNPCRFCRGEVSPNRDPNTGFAWIECETCYSRGPKYLIGHRQMVATDIIALAEIWNRRNELCRAAPAGGDWHAGYKAGYHDAKLGHDHSAPAGSGEVEALVKKWRELAEKSDLIDLPQKAQIFRWCAEDLAALLRKLQQGAE